MVQHSALTWIYPVSNRNFSRTLRFIDYTLDYCDQTDHYPGDARFRWTCEASWTIKIPQSATQGSRSTELLKRIKKRGRIEVTGMFFPIFSSLLMKPHWPFKPDVKCFKDQGIDVTAAMQNDVNGMAGV